MTGYKIITWFDEPLNMQVYQIEYENGFLDLTENLLFDCRDSAILNANETIKQYEKLNHSNNK